MFKSGRKCHIEFDHAEAAEKREKRFKNGEKN